MGLTPAAYRGENPVGIWKINVKDKVNPETRGHFKSWSLQLWGEASDASKARNWSPAELGQPDEEQTGSEPPAGTKITHKPKPTDLLPGDHGVAEGEADKPGLGDTQPTAPADIATGPGSESSEQEGDSAWYQSGLDTVKDNKHWFAGGFGLVVFAGVAIGAFFVIRGKYKKQVMQDLSAERGEYQAVPEEVPMGILGREGVRRQSSERRPATGLAAAAAGQGSARDKELYDAFGENDLGDEDEVSEHGEHAPLNYHDDFLQDDEGGSSNSHHHRRTEDSATDRGRTSPGSKTRSAGDDTIKQPREADESSISSWQDADPRAQEPGSTGSGSHPRKPVGL